MWHGFTFALEQGYRTIVGMDADFSHDPREIPKLVEASNRFDVVQGSRYIGGVRVLDWPLRRLILSTWANLYARLVTGLPLKDITSGYRCYRREVLEAIDLAGIRSNGYVFLIEMSFLAWRKGFSLGEVPIIFQERRSGQSKISKSIIWESIWVVFKLRVLEVVRAGVAPCHCEPPTLGGHGKSGKGTTALSLSLRATDPRGPGRSGKGTALSSLSLRGARGAGDVAVSMNRKNIRGDRRVVGCADSSR